jgi:hypothetical protein
MKQDSTETTSSPSGPVPADSDKTVEEHHDVQQDHQPDQQPDQQPNQQPDQQPERQDRLARSDRPQRPARQEHQDAMERRFSTRRPTTSITNFKFSEVLSCDTPVKDTDSTTLLQYLVAKAKISGQFELYKVLNATLAATNHECEFPSLARPHYAQNRFPPRDSGAPRAV